MLTVPAGTSRDEQNPQHGRVSRMPSRIVGCDIHLRNLNDGRNLAGHIREERVSEDQSDESTHQCDYCGKTYSYSCHLKVHMRTHTGALPYSCDICDRRFNDRYSLQRHMLKHSDVRAFNCPMCDFAFKSQSNLLSHMLTHARSEDGLHSCNFCARKFEVSAEYKLHVRIHLDVKPFSCKLCSMRFTDRNSRREHMNSHQDDEPFVCEPCGKRFRNKLSLYFHSRSHYTGQTYACEFCGRIYWHVGNLNRHVRFKHRNGIRKYKVSNEPSGESLHGPNNLIPDTGNCVAEQLPQTSSSNGHFRTEFNERQYQTPAIGYYPDWQQSQATGSSSVYQQASVIQDSNQWADSNFLNYHDRSRQSTRRPPEDSVTCYCGSDCMEGNYCVIDQILGLNNEASAPVAETGGRSNTRGVSNQQTWIVGESSGDISWHDQALGVGEDPCCDVASYNIETLGQTWRQTLEMTSPLSCEESDEIQAIINDIESSYRRSRCNEPDRHSMGHKS
ncbi:hypothetical protein QAD02_011126 [Eretmocerus hayati]|uniref:Uncharacterized protein n=1 Tax=Eretmocerus hayati TaxID=131215 RepID=A0ACC2NVN2_9HYME|nr:hypothetical protein QAD02_011126 [Eretmocerus hayati]